MYDWATNSHPVNQNCRPGHRKLEYWATRKEENPQAELRSKLKIKLCNLSLTFHQHK